MAYPIKTYADIYDQTYGGAGFGNRGRFGHLVIRDSNTVGKDYLLVGCNDREDTNLDSAIRLHKRQVKQVVRALNRWLVRVDGERGTRNA